MLIAPRKITISILLSKWELKLCPNISSIDAKKTPLA
jgi:hypothetical protein